MLTEKEKKGCVRLLEMLTNEEILSLKDTVTNRFIAAENRRDAMKAIIEYSESAVELLRRRKIRKELLFQYLADQGIVVRVNSDKHDLICHTLQFWGSSVSSDIDLQDTEATAPVPKADPAKEQIQIITTSLHQRLGETFVQWFYQLLNAENPSVGRSGEDSFGPHHFWENCTLKLISRAPDLTEEHFEGNVLVSQRLQALVKEEMLIFSPNISADGVRVKTDPHGLVMVMACGTISQYNSCLGVFEQVFGLVKNPLNEHNWKVKVSQLHVSSSQVRDVPRLSDSSTRQLLSIANSLSLVPNP